MILKGNQRAGGGQLAAHLLNSHDNEHILVHEMRGFVADDLRGAFHEAYATSRGTRAKQFLFSLSLNPPPGEMVSTAQFEAAIERAEKRLGLDGQPRAVVFHEKEGRRHAHVVWSRIDTEEMRAINLPHYKLKLRDVSRELFLEHGWRLPRGLVNSQERDPTNFTHAQWAQAKRGGQDPKALKAMFQECWAASDSGKAFAAALQARGYTLARGDRRGYVAVDFRGEVYAVAKYADVKTKDVRERLGDPQALPSIDEAKAAISARMSAMLRKHVREVEDEHDARLSALAARRDKLMERQRSERTQLEQVQAARWEEETARRMRRFSKGISGLWDRLTGKHRQITYRNEIEALEAYQRDRAEKDKLIERHLDERKPLHAQIRLAREKRAEAIAELHRDLAYYRQWGGKEPPSLTAHFQAADSGRRHNEPDRWHGPELER